MKILLIGDSHGNAPFIKNAIDLAKSINTDLCIQLGDFGFWPKSGFASLINHKLTVSKMPLWVIDGNHDYMIDAYTFLKDPIFSNKPGLHYIPRGSITEIEGLKIGFMGGAVSIDQQSRTPGRSWWAEEVMSMDDLEACRANGKVDIWLTHDAVETPPGRDPYDFGPMINTKIINQRHMMRMAYDIAQPAMHVHGHWHYRYGCDGKYGRVHGLGFEGIPALLFIELNEGKIGIVS